MPINSITAHLSAHLSTPSSFWLLQMSSTSSSTPQHTPQHQPKSSRIKAFLLDLVSSIPFLHPTSTQLQSYRSRVLNFPLKLTSSEVSGSLGDLGTLIPLVVTLARQGSISLPATLFFGGLTNLLNGIYHDLPLPTQPMKAISAVAIAEGMTRQEVTASGVIVGWVVFLIGVTGLIEAVNKVVPREVVSGLQLGLGVKLAGLGVKWITDLPWFSQLDSITLGVVSFCLAMFLLKTENDKHLSETSPPSSKATVGRWKRYLPPTALTLFLVGLICATITLSTAEPGTYTLPLKFLGPPVAFWAVGDLSGQDWR